MENVINREIKDSIFTSMFSEPKYMLQLYKCLHPEDDKVTESDLTDVTIENVITNNQYNDLGFIVKNKLMIMVECQSSWSESIAFRSLLYMASTYTRIVYDNKIDIYDLLPKLPKPELYVIYAGMKKNNLPQRITMDSSFDSNDHCLNGFYVNVISEENAENILKEYIQFSTLTTSMIKEMGNNENTLDIIINTCIKNGILKEYIENHSAEVKSKMKHLWCDQEKAMDEFRNHVKTEAHAEGLAEGRAEGRAEGKAEGRAEGRAEIIKTLFNSNLSAEEISRLVNIPLDQIIAISKN